MSWLNLIQLFRERRGRRSLTGERRGKRSLARAKGERFRSTTTNDRNTGGNLIDRHHVVLFGIFVRSTLPITRSNTLFIIGFHGFFPLKRTGG
jgi:hypothetical protein